MRNPRFSMRQWIVAVVLSFSLAGCTAVRLGYNNGESIAFYWLDGYADFAPDQTPWAKEQIAGWFVWHRQTQLGDYAKLMTSYQARLQKPVSKADVLNEYGQVRQHALAMVDRALPSLADLALRMNPEQIGHLKEKFASNNKKFRKQYLSDDPEEQQTFRYKKIRKQAEYWLGDLTAEQETQIRAASDSRPLDNALWLADRQQRQARLLELLTKIHEQKPPRSAVQAMLRDYAVTVIEGNGDPDQKMFFDTSRESTAQMVADIINLASPPQRAHASRQLQKWIDDINQMSRQAAREGT